jgi:predicted CXXCH cytochrome family protein
MMHHAVLVMAVAAAASAQDNPLILAPAPDSVVAAGTLRIIGRAEGQAQLLLDGVKLDTQTPAASVLFSDVKIGEGPHELLLKGGSGESRIRFTASKAQSGEKMFRPHPPAAACDACHAVRNEAWAMKRPTLSPLCFTCHQREKFVPSHTHNTETLADCQICHAPHGSAAKAHLNKAREVVCKQCHN